MEHIDPGTPLDELDTTTDVIGGVVTVLRKLIEQPPPLLDMPRIDRWLRDRLNDDNVSDLAPGQARASVDERRAAIPILDELTSGPTIGHLCHGDLHPGNILVRADGRLFLIDPRGVSGEVAYDVAVLALKAVRGAPAAARPVAAQLAGCVGVDADRAQAWVTVATAARV